MKKQAGHRQYNIPDADLYVKCLELIRLALEPYNIKEFEKYGYGLDRLRGFKNLCDKFSALRDDDEIVGEQMTLTEKKDAASERLKNAVRSVMTRVEMKYNNRTGRYRKFGTAKMGDMTDPQLLFCGRRVVRVARKEIDFFAEVGLNDTIIQRVQEAAQDFENALNIQQDKVADRDIAVEARVEQGNKLYQEMIVLCNIGKDIWAELDPVRYEQFVVYESNNDQKIARKEREKEKTTP